MSADFSPVCRKDFRVAVYLRNEAIFGRAPYLPAILFEPQQRVQGLVKGAFVRGAVAEEEGEAFFVDAAGNISVFGGEAFVLKADGALQEPVGLGELVDEQLFGRVSGLVFA